MANSVFTTDKGQEFDLILDGKTLQLKEPASEITA
jgi:hypothetical protein